MDCPRCGTELDAEAQSCAGCGIDLSAALSSQKFPDTERRQLTVMFCDLVGSTRMSHNLDPEDLRDVLREYQERTRRVVSRYGGFIARYVGDGVLVYFGYPVAHEDAAACALHSALDIVDSVGSVGKSSSFGGGKPLSVRIGVATGTVVVGDVIGHGASQEAAAVGETPNVASRLQGLAEPNSICVTDLTRKLAGGEFRYDDLGQRALAGLDAPLRVWNVLGKSGAESRFAARLVEPSTPLIGRETELETLREYWRQSAAGGNLVAIVGDAGIGKSRLAETLAMECEGGRHSQVRLQCSLYHANTPLHPFARHLELESGFTNDDSASEKLDKLERYLARYFRDPNEITSLFAALLSLPHDGRYASFSMSPQQQRQRTIQSLIALLERRCADGPLLVLFEDAHWIDPSSMELLGILAGAVPAMRILVIVTSRTAPEADWLRKPHVHELTLERLSRDDSEELARHVIAADVVTADLVDQVVTQADGVPLFIEELSKAVAMRDTVDDTLPPFALPRPQSVVPSTLRDSLMSRLDQLGSDAREVAQVGATIGREFSYELIAAISPLPAAELETALTRLAGGAIVFPQGESNSRTYLFKHALVQDVAYSSLLRSKRQSLHHRIAERLEAYDPDHGGGSEPEVLAHHYTQAGDAPRAGEYWAEAAQRALDGSAFVEAIGHVTQGLSLLARASPSRELDQLRMRLEILGGAGYRAVKGFASAEAEQSFFHARDLCESLENLPRLVDVRRGLFACYYARGALSLAYEQGIAVSELAERLDDQAARMLGHWMLGCISFWRGDFRKADRQLERAISLYDPDQQQANTLALQIDPGVNAICHRSWGQWILGYPDQAIETGELAVRTARELEQPFALAMALFFACETRTCAGDFVGAGRYLAELESVSLEHGLEYLASCAKVLRGQERILEGEPSAGIEQIHAALADFRVQQAGLGMPWALSVLAMGCAGLGDIAEGLPIVDQAMAAASASGERHWLAELHRLQGELLLAGPERDDIEAEKSFEQALTVARDQSAKSLELRAALSLARLYRAQDREDAGVRRVAEIMAGFTEGAATADLVAARSIVSGNQSAR